MNNYIEIDLLIQKKFRKKIITFCNYYYQGSLALDNSTLAIKFSIRLCIYNAKNNFFVVETKLAELPEYRMVQ